ncbi:MAG: HD domain-containing protein [Bacteroidia bacterium]|nr:HD domain-containing protein [Bacteroidia bacterium]
MTIEQKAENFVLSLLKEKLSNQYIYHNISHTKRVVDFIREISEFEKIAKKDIQILELAGWFHDVGYINGNDDHEINSAKIARDFLEKEKTSSATIEKVKNCILITTNTEEPKNIFEKIILDADCGHLGNKNYSEVSELLREEWILLGNEPLTDIEWIENNIDFFTRRHQYYTDYAINNWQATKDKNLAQLYKSLKKLKKEKDRNKQKAEEIKLKKQKARTPERGIETMFRVTLRNHINLSNIADTKANILLSVNAIIISLALSSLIPKLDNPSNHYLIIPTSIFVVFSLVSMALSVVATRPNITSGNFTKEDVKQKKVNLLFFGNFHKVKLNEFEWAMGEMMKDRDYLYSSMTKDLYYLGLVLNKKYKILRITYTIFLIGIIASVVAFAVSFKLANP